MAFGFDSVKRLDGQSERKSGHDIRQRDDAIPERVADTLDAARAVRDRQDCVRVRVIDEPVREERVQQRLDRGVGLDASKRCVRSSFTIASSESDSSAASRSR